MKKKWVSQYDPFHVFSRVSLIHLYESPRSAKIERQRFFALFAKNRPFGLYFRTPLQLLCFAEPAEGHGRLSENLWSAKTERFFASLCEKPAFFALHCDFHFSLCPEPAEG
ncbi:MAG: hypothetical protein V2I97_00200 [Desulfococcaceae bacterium]|jgi:hypothetical protein|nr:hypothetical protein [Desulfococcaceae bacterium]